MADDILLFIKEKVEKIADDVDGLKVSHAEMKIDVKHHVKRSDQLEDLYKHLDENRIQPLEKEASQIKGVVGFIGFLVTLAGVVAAFLLLKH